MWCEDKKESRQNEFGLMKSVDYHFARFDFGHGVLCFGTAHSEIRKLIMLIKQNT